MALGILLLLLALAFQRMKPVFKSEDLIRREREWQVIKEGAEEHRKRVRGNPSKMAREAFGSKPESKPEDKKTKSASAKEQKKEEKKK
jgi:hypothetical protein